MKRLKSIINWKKLDLFCTGNGIAYLEVLT